MNTSSSIIDKKVTSKFESISQYMGILKYNLKIILNLNFLVGIAFVVTIPIICSVRLLDYVSLASIGEKYLSIIGIILIPYLCSIENKHNIKEVICSRKTPHFKVMIVRVIMMMLIMLVMICSIMILAKFQGSSFNFLELVFGVWISAAFLGMIGFTVANLINNISAAYIIAFSYYFMEYATKGRYTKDLYLFSLVSGNFQYGKFMLLVLIFVLLIFNSLIIISQKDIS